MGTGAPGIGTFLESTSGHEDVYAGHEDVRAGLGAFLPSMGIRGLGMGVSCLAPRDGMICLCLIHGPSLRAWGSVGRAWGCHTWHGAV